MEYKAIGKAMRHYTDSGEDVMTDPHPNLTCTRPNSSWRRGPVPSVLGKLGVASIEIPEDEQHLLRWLDAGFHGEMEYMRRHGVAAQPAGGARPGHRAGNQRSDGLLAVGVHAMRARCWAIGP